MNTAEQVSALINKWKGQYTPQEIVQKTAEACLGWSYVWGGYGQICNPSNRKTYANRSSCPSGEAAEIIARCQVLKQGKSSCSGCAYYPNGTTRFFDCRGFTGWLLQQIGFSLTGAGATSQWNTASNWSAKGTIDKIPENKVCCVFWQDKNDKAKMAHTGMHIGGGVIVHCSGTVKYGKVTDKGWTHFGVPKCFDGGDVPVPVWRPTIRRGSSGEDVKYCQELLIKLGYDLGSYGSDGRFGAKTEEAVRSFQKANSLGVDGVVGPLTWQALEEATPVTTRYKVTIPHLTEAQVISIKAQYPEAKSEVEK